MELIRCEEGQLIVAEQIVNAIKNFEKEKKEIEEKEKALREKLAIAMEKYNQNKWVSPDGSLQISYTPETEVTRFDTKRFEKEHQDLYWEYLVTSKKKSSIRMTIKDVEK